jgi:hypothetical protein
MSNDPMVRGNAAPAGFASSVSGFLQAYVAQQRLEHPSASMNTRARHNVLDGCSSAPVAAGDDDPRIRVLALASPGPRWNPGPQQIAAVHGAGHKPGSLSGEANDKLTGDKLLNALALGAALDLQTLHARELSQVRKGPEAAPSQEALVSYERERADRAELLLSQERVAREAAGEHYRRERDQRRQLQAILRNTGELPAESNGGEPAEPERQRLPAGVRQRGKAFQAFWRGASGRQEQKGGFATAEEATAHRKAEMERVSQARQTTRAPEMSTEPAPDFNPSPEELAAMQEEATR